MQRYELEAGEQSLVREQGHSEYQSNQGKY